MLNIETKRIKNITSTNIAYVNTFNIIAGIYFHLSKQDTK